MNPKLSNQTKTGLLTPITLLIKESKNPTKINKEVQSIDKTRKYFKHPIKIIIFMSDRHKATGLSVKKNLVKEKIIFSIKHMETKIINLTITKKAI